MRIGIDFDNTIACYDGLCAALATEQGLIPKGEAGTKAEVKRMLLELKEGMTKWQRLQGQMYGPYMKKADLYPCFLRFLFRCKLLGHKIFIVSHKTEFGHFDESRTNLREAARNWMDRHGFFTATGFALTPSQVFFEATVNAKIARICSLDLDYFVDDLEKVLSDPNFPKRTQRIWFHADVAGPTTSLTRCSDWAAIRQTVFGND